MTQENSKEKEELVNALKELKKIQKGNTSKEVVDAVIEKVKESVIQEDQVARSVDDQNEIHNNL